MSSDDAFLDADVEQLLTVWRVLRGRCPAGHPDNDGRTEALAAKMSERTGAPPDEVAAWLRIPAHHRPAPSQLALGGYSVGDIAASVRGPRAVRTKKLTVVKQSGKVGLKFVSTRVSNVVSGGAADVAGLKNGMRMVSINDTRVDTQHAVTAAFKAAPETFTVEIASEGACEEEDESAASGVATLPAVLKSFTVRAVAIGQKAIADGRISRDAVDEFDTSLMLGLPGLIMLECALNSLEEPLQSQALRLTDGHKVTPESFRDDPGMLALHHALVEGRRLIQQASFDVEETNRLRNAVLTAGGDQGCARSIEITRVAAFFQGIATDLSRLSRFQREFGAVLQALLDATAPAAGEMAAPAAGPVE